MADTGFTFNGIHSKDKGITLQGPVQVSAPKPKRGSISIPGRNGNIRQHDGSFEDRTIRVPCYMLSDYEGNRIGEINHWLFADDAYHKFTDDSDSTHFYLAKATAGAGIQLRAGVLNDFTLQFDAKPQRFLKSGEEPIVLGALSVGAEKNIINPNGFEAAPLIKVSGLSVSNHDGVQLWFQDENGNESVLEININVTLKDLTYDAEMDFSYNDTVSLDALVTVNDPIRLKAGKTTIYITNGSAQNITIVPRWWTL